MATCIINPGNDEYERVENNNYELTECSAYSHGGNNDQKINYYNMQDTTAQSDDYAFTECAAYHIVEE